MTFKISDQINRKSAQNWKSICLLTVFKHKFCNLNACLYNYRLHFVMKFAYHTFKSIFNKNIIYAKNCGSVSKIIICFPFSIIIASQALKVGGVFRGQITR